MPQLDYATYASQLFWLMIVFWSFYFVSLRYILPTLSEILKLREKKLKKSQSTLHGSEQTEIAAETDGIFKTAFAESRQILTQFVSYSSSWMSQTIHDLNTKALVTLNKTYLQAMASIAAKKYVLLKEINQA